MVGTGVAGCDGCGCGCFCCAGSGITGITLTWGSGNWGTGVTSSYAASCGGAITCNKVCENIGTPSVVLDYEEQCENEVVFTCNIFGALQIRDCFQDVCAAATGETNCALQCCFQHNSFDVEMECEDFSCGSPPIVGFYNYTVHVTAALVQFSGEDHCRLVVMIWFCGDAAGTPVLDASSRAIFYRSPEITDCCDVLTLDKWQEYSALSSCTSSAVCSSAPSTITATPTC